MLGCQAAKVARLRSELPLPQSSGRCRHCRHTKAASRVQLMPASTPWFKKAFAGDFLAPVCRSSIRFPIMARALVLSLVVALASAETVQDCVEGKCRGCSGEQCQLCREDENTVSACVSSCMENICRGCGGEQCQLCREDANTLNSCCSGTEGIDMCKAESKDPCDGIYGADGLQCAWEQDVKSCVETKCHGCGGEQCQLCRQDANTIAACCDDHYHSVNPPKMCIDSKEEAVTSCFDSKCRGCGGEQCQLCREDAKSECCTGAMRTPSCESSKPVLP